MSSSKSRNAILRHPSGEVVAPVHPLTHSATPRHPRYDVVDKMHPGKRLHAFRIFVLTGDTALTVVICLGITAVQFAIGNVLDPMLLGQTLRLSSFGIILSLAFWGLVWGIPGTFLAVPIMVALMIVCAQIPWLRPVAIMLSREGLPDDETDDAAPALQASRKPPLP